MFRSRYLFQLNDPTPDKYKDLLKLRDDLGGKYLLFNVSDSAMSLGFVCFPRSVRPASIARRLPDLHLKVCDIPSIDASDAIKKLGEYKEFGFVPRLGKKSDFLMAKEMLDAGCSLDSVRRCFPVEYYKSKTELLRLYYGYDDASKLDAENLLRLNPNANLSSSINPTRSVT